MSLFSDSTIKEAEEIANKASDDFIPFARGTYEVTVMDFEIKEQDRRIFDKGKVVGTDGTEEIAVVTLSMDKNTVGDGEVKDIEGNPAKFNSTRLYLNPLKLGIGPNGPSIARRFVASCLERPVNEDVSVRDFESVLLDKDFKGKTLHVIFSEFVHPTTKKMSTKVTDVMPAPKA